MAGTSPALPPTSDSVAESQPLDHQPQALPDGDATRSRKRG
jgi:hypothetical protein